MRLGSSKAEYAMQTNSRAFLASTKFPKLPSMQWYTSDAHCIESLQKTPVHAHVRVSSWSSAFFLDKEMKCSSRAFDAQKDDRLMCDLYLIMHES